MKRLALTLGAVVLAVALAACPSRSDDGPATLPRADLLDPSTCKNCHADHYREWSGSMHAYASDDPVFIAMNKRGQRETNGALGTFCVGCHAPMAVREGATKDGLNLASLPASLKGVTCFFCHTVDAVEGSHDAQLHLSDEPIMRGAFSDPVPNTAHRATYSALHDRDKLDSSQMCGACHDIVNGHGVVLERTFAEWKETVFSKAPGGATCGQCHMGQSASLEPIAQAPNVFARRRHAHGLAGVDVALTRFPEAEAQRREVKTLLDPTLQTALCVAPGASTRIRVLADNVAAGHSFPSGASQDRRLWAEVIAYSNNQIVYQSGAIADGESETKNADPDRWLLRDCIFDDKGAEVHMFWQAAAHEGNALPGQVTFDALDPRFYKTHVIQKYPRDGSIPSAVDRVTLRFRLRPMGIDVLDDLVATGDLDPSVKSAMPTYDIGQDPVLEWTAATATETFREEGILFQCITKTGFAVTADKVPAVNSSKCKP